MATKKINILLTVLLCFTGLAAQEKLDIFKSINLDLGHTVSVGKDEFTGAISTVNSEKLSHKNSLNPTNQLFGMLSGLQVMQNTGTVWEDGASLKVRGLGTLSSKEPLVIIDGFERSLKEVTSKEIESISVLKDATATAIYGMRGANGVILVTTKRGAESAPQINFSYEFNMATPNRLPDFANGYTYASALNEAMANDGLQPRYSETELGYFESQRYPLFYPDVDWFNEALRDFTFGDNVNFSASGGGKYVKYFTMLDFSDSRGLLQPTEMNDGYSTQQKYSKLNIRTNLDIILSPTTNVQLNLLGNFTEHNRPGIQTDELFTYLYQTPSAAFPVKTQNGIWGGTSVYGNNPIASIAGKGYSRSQTRTLFADIHLIQDLSAFLPGLKMGTKIALDNTASYWDSNTKNFGYESAIMDPITGEQKFTKMRDEGTLSFSKSVGAAITHFNFEMYLKYAKSWGKHNLNSTFVYSMDKLSKKENNSGRAFMDVIGQAHYSYANRYLVDFSLSGSASSVLVPSDRWGVFPAIGAGWILSNEEFIKRDWLDMLKIRASFGMVGRADYGIDLYKNIYGGGNSYIFGDDLKINSGGMKFTQLGIDGLTFEKSHKLNVGIDFAAWNKLSVTVDAFYDHRTDILIPAENSISSVFGMAVPKINNGVVDNRGIEGTLNWDDRIGNVTYHLGGQFSFTRNKIINQNEEYRPHGYLKRTGGSIGQIFGYEVIGIYQSQDEIDNREVKQYLGNVRSGDLMFKDQNGDKRIDIYDQIALGYNSTCPEVYYSFDLGAEYKGLGFYVLFQGTGNYSKLLDTRSIYRPLVGNNTISNHYYENRWTKDNPDALYPRLTYSGSDNNYNTNSLWVANASFLKLRTLEFYYNLPVKLLKKTKIVNKAKIYARGHDLFCWDGIDLQDPEAVGAVYPAMTQFSFGFDLTF